MNAVKAKRGTVIDANIVFVPDEHPDLSWLGQIGPAPITYKADDWQIVDRSKHGIWTTAHDRYFVGGENYKNTSLSTRTKREYVMQDWKRLESFGTSWWMVGVQLKATVEREANGQTILEEVYSPGIWGVESDAGDHINDIASYEKKWLEEDLTLLLGSTIDLGDVEDLEEVWE